MLKSKGRFALNILNIRGRFMFDIEDLQDFIYKILLLVVIIITMSFVTLIAWNLSVSLIFEIRRIDFMEACWLNILAHILLRPIEISFDK
jgi:hypothetical protein